MLRSHGANLNKETGMLIINVGDKDKTKQRMLIRACEEYAKRKNIIEFKLTKLKLSTFSIKLRIWAIVRLSELFVTILLCHL